jgi:SP family general alpha glucoside:H+ symporter-like MFS transporter
MQKTVESQHLETGAMETEPKSQNELETVGFASDRKDHDITKWQAVKENKKAVAWIALAIFVLCLQGFDNQAGGIVVGIEQFRKDFGFPFAGNYVIPAEWQSAFTGGPIALAIVGALFGGWLADGEFIDYLFAWIVG